MAKQKSLPGAGRERYIPYEEYTGEKSIVFLLAIYWQMGYERFIIASAEECLARLASSYTLANRMATTSSLALEYSSKLNVLRCMNKASKKGGYKK